MADRGEHPAIPPRWSWALGDITLEVRTGDLFSAPEQVWVNSEQTDFVMAADGGSVSAQMKRRWPAAQSELLAQTGGRMLPPGTVLRTSGPDGRHIYHAGFHEPTEGYFGDEEKAAAYLEYIGSCVDRILDAVPRQGWSSIAFPLLGTGEFGLPVERLAEAFFESVVEHARRATARLDVALLVWNPAELGTVIQHGTRLFAGNLGVGAPLLTPAGGHPLVQQLRQRPRAVANPEMTERALLRFAEIALATDLAVAADLLRLSVDTVLGGLSCSKRGRHVTFGLIRDRLGFVQARRADGLPAWFERRLDTLRSPAAQAAIGRLVADRNAYAHYRRPRSLEDIIGDVDLLFGARALPEPWPNHRGLWLRSVGDREYGLLYGADFEGRQLTWLVPQTRRHLTQTFEGGAFEGYVVPE